MKKFVALARVSSREQEPHRFSPQVQEDAFKRYAVQAGVEIVRLFRIAETASQSDERKAFRELIAYAKKHAVELNGLLFYKVDRPARNPFDSVELERLESGYELPFISVSQPTEDNPVGRRMRRTLANMASFYTEQQALDRPLKKSFGPKPALFARSLRRRISSGSADIACDAAPRSGQKWLGFERQSTYSTGC